MYWPEGMESKYFFRSIDKNSNTKYSLDSCINTSNNLQREKGQVQRKTASYMGDFLIASVNTKLENAFSDLDLDKDNLICNTKQLVISIKNTQCYCFSQYKLYRGVILTALILKNLVFRQFPPTRHLSPTHNQFANHMTVVDLISKNNESVIREGVQQPTDWWGLNHLPLNINKTNTDKTKQTPEGWWL